MEDTQDLIFEIEGNVGSVGSSDLLGVVSLVMTGGTEALHLGKTSDSFEQQTGKKAKTVSRSLARTTTNIWETGNKKILRQVYSNHLSVERPTPKNFIIQLAEYLKRQTIRKQDTPLNGLERNETIPKEPNVHQMFTKCSLQIFFPRDTSISYFLLWHSSTRSFSRWLGHNFCGFSPYPTAKTLWPCSLKNILVSNFPLNTFWMWYMIFFRKK